MADLTISNVKTAMGPGPLKATYGDWTATIGDAATTLTVAGGKLYGYQFHRNSTTGPIQPMVLVSQSGTTGYLTVTVYTQETVTDGTFIIWTA